MQSLLSIADVAFRVKEKFEDTGARFVAAVPVGNRVLLGAGSGSFAALCDAVGDKAAHDLTASARRDDSRFSYDENFCRDSWRMESDDGTLLATFIKG